MVGKQFHNGNKVGLLVVEVNPITFHCLGKLSSDDDDDIFNSATEINEKMTGFASERLGKKNLRLFKTYICDYAIKKSQGRSKRKHQVVQICYSDVNVLKNIECVEKLFYFLNSFEKMFLCWVLFFIFVSDKVLYNHIRGLVPVIVNSEQLI